MPTYEEARDEYCRAMGVELGTKFHLLWNEFAQLSFRWNEYVELFGNDQEQFDVMNKVAPGFFSAVQRMYWEHILLGLSRFADKQSVSGRVTLSLESLRKSAGSGAVPRLSELIDTARGNIKFAQDWRNRRIAHTDYEHVQDKAAKPLAAASRLRVGEAMSSIHAVLEAVSFHFMKISLYFDGTGYAWNGLYLLRELRLITKLRAERQDRLNTGNYTADDINWKKWLGEPGS